MKESTYRTWRRIHALSGVLPVGIFLVVHFATNATSIAGREAFLRTADRLERLPYRGALEIGAIAVPLLFHVVLGILLSDSAYGVDECTRYPRPWMMWAQRATGGLLVVYVIFHVWGIRFSPDLLAGKLDLYAVTHKTLEHPGMLVFYVVGVLAASLHFGVGLAGAAGYLGIAPSSAAARTVTRVAWIASLALAVVGLNALLAFVGRPARWLEP